MPITTRSRGIILKSLKILEFEIRRRIETIQTTALLKSARTLFLD